MAFVCASVAAAPLSSSVSTSVSSVAPRTASTLFANAILRNSHISSSTRTRPIRLSGTGLLSSSSSSSSTSRLHRNSSHFSTTTTPVTTLSSSFLPTTTTVNNKQLSTTTTLRPTPFITMSDSSPTPPTSNDTPAAAPTVDLSAPTIFDKILSREIPADVIYEDEFVLAFRDINPQAPVHFLVIPKRRIAMMSLAKDTDKELLGHLMLAAAKVARLEGLADDGYRMLINNGADGLQSVFHLHVHVMGGRKLKWGPF